MEFDVQPVDDNLLHPDRELPLFEWAKCIVEWHMPGGLELLHLSFCTLMTKLRPARMMMLIQWKALIHLPTRHFSGRLPRTTAACLRLRAFAS